MQCPNCRHENPEKMKFCGECGTALRNLCPVCSFDNPLGFKFCGECGTALRSAPPSTPVPPPVSPPPPVLPEALSTRPADTEEATHPEAERRQLTVMFCDLVGSTPLAEQLDPEDLRSLLQDYQAACTKVIRRFEGHVAKYMGDGMMVYFGYPLAHEDDARRAAQAGLGILEAIGQLNLRIEQEYGVQLGVRCGAHTGPVIIGDMGEGDHFEANAIVGQTPNIAARLENVAEPNTFVVSGATWRLIKGYFQGEDLGRQELKGVSQPVSVHRVLHASGARTRVAAGAQSGLTPLVGREREIHLLHDCWQAAREGRGQAVLLGGEAGLGKSRLVQALKERVAEDSESWLTESFCSPFYQNTALYPTIETFERAILQFGRDDTPETKRGKLEGLLTQYGIPLAEGVPLFASLLSFPAGDEYPPLDLNPMRQKQRTLDLLVHLLVTRASHQPVLFVIEDLHWADASTLELIDRILEHVPESRLLTVFTTRPEFQFLRSTDTPLHRINLARFQQTDVERMVEKVAAGKALPPEVLQQVINKTDGIPLFVEELTRMVLESGQLREAGDHYEMSAPLPSLAIPTTLHDSLMARLDRLSTVKTVAQIGAVLGREFSYELLRAVSSLSDVSLQHELAQLVEAELLYERGTPPLSSYVFKHALIQDAAYHSLLKNARQQYHRQTAEALTTSFPEEVEVNPELVAHHYTEAGERGKAVPLWYQAGQRAIQRSAIPEAFAHLNKGLELLKTLPDTQDRTQQEILLQIGLGTASIAVRGYSAPEVEQAFGRARHLCSTLGETSQIFAVLWGLWAYYVVRGEFSEAHRQGKEMLAFAERAQDRELLLEVQPVLGHNHFWTGDLAQARRVMEEGLRLYDPEKHRGHATAYGQDPAVVCLSYLSWILWLQGEPDQALARSAEAIQLAEGLNHAYSLGYALAFAAFFHQMRGEYEQALKAADATLALAIDNGFPIWQADGDMVRGWARHMLGEEDSMAQLERGLAMWDMAGARLCRTQQLGMLAEALGRSGEITAGLNVVEEARTMSRAKGESHYLAELLRLRGELLLAQSAPDEAAAEESLRQALAIAQQQGARGWELRTTLSLYRLFRQQGRAEAARPHLEEVYSYFTEGFETPDLRAARECVGLAEPTSHPVGGLRR